MFDDAEYDAVIESALCRNESPELALLENAERLRLATPQEFGRAIADAFFDALLEDCWRSAEKLRATNESLAIAASTVTFADSQARLGKVLNEIVERSTNVPTSAAVQS